MRIQLAYQRSGENEAELTRFLRAVKTTLEIECHDVYCPLFDTNNHGIRDSLEHLQKQDVLLVLARKPDVVEGASIETGAAYALDKRLVLAIRRDIGYSAYRHTRQLANQTITFKDELDLISKLEKEFKQE
jgi:hypothetical protein